MFSALLRWRCYKRGITKQQAQALVVITMGLLITAFDKEGSDEVSVVGGVVGGVGVGGGVGGGGAGSVGGTGGMTGGENGAARSSASSDGSQVGSMLLLPSGGMSNNNLTSTQQQQEHTSLTPLPGERPEHLVLGMFLALCGAFGYAWVYVLSEQITISKETPLSPFAFASYGGFYGSLVCSSYIIMFVGPHWTRDVVQPIQDSGASYFTIMGLYVLFLLMCGAHNLSFVFLGKNGGGAVVAGVNKAVQTITVFVFSAIVFGPTHPEQRMTTQKVTALVLVVVGVLMYAMAKKAKSRSGAQQWTSVKMEDYDDDSEFGLRDELESGASNGKKRGVKIIEMSQSIRAR